MELGRSGRTIDHAVGGAGELSEFQLRVIANARHRKISRFGSSLTRARGVQAELGGHVWTAGDELQHHGFTAFTLMATRLARARRSRATRSASTATRIQVKSRAAAAERRRRRRFRFSDIPLWGERWSSGVWGERWCGRRGAGGDGCGRARGLRPWEWWKLRGARAMRSA